MPDVSVITPAYNARRFIDATIDSVRGQTLESWEHVIVDDGSRDGTGDAVAARVREDGRIRLVRQENGGVCSARNMGARASDPRARHMLFLDADDVLEPTMLERLTRYLDEHPQAGMVHCRHRYIDDAGRVIGEEPGEWPWARLVRHGDTVRALGEDERVTPFESIFLVAVVVPSMALLRRSVYEQVGGWDEVLGQGCEDTDLVLRMALRAEVHFAPEVLVRYRRHATQSTAGDCFAPQYVRLAEKWSRAEGLDGAQREVLEQAWRFREEVFKPWMLMRGARSAARRLRLVSAARSAWQAARLASRRWSSGRTYVKGG